MEQIFINIHSTIWESCGWNSSCCDQKHNQTLQDFDRNREKFRHDEIGSMRSNSCRAHFSSVPFSAFLLTLLVIL